MGRAMAMKENAKSISVVADTAVAPEQLSANIGRFLEIVRTHGTTAGVYAHASVGCLHVRPVVNMKTAEGCDYNVAFCIIPTLRGEYRSRDIDSLVREAGQLAAQGVKEILLISQDSSFFGIDRKEKQALSRLLRRLNDVALGRVDR